MDEKELMTEESAEEMAAPVEEMNTAPAEPIEAEKAVQEVPEQPATIKKKGGVLRLVALVLVVALLGSAGGAAIMARMLNWQQMVAVSGSVSNMPVNTLPPKKEGPAYELVRRKLPEELLSNDTGKSLTVAQVYAQNVNCVVGVEAQTISQDANGKAVTFSSGTGFILTEDGYILTNCHVVDGAEKLKVILNDGTEYDAHLVAADSDMDIALVEIQAKDLPTVTIGDSDTLTVGEEVVAIGNPLGELTFTATNGILSAVDREIDLDGTSRNMLQTNAAINSGNSGGPLFDMDGNVIGVTTAKYSGLSMSGASIEGLGFAIPINAALEVAYDLAEYGFVRGRAYLGITVRTLGEDIAEFYNMPIGPRIESIVPGSCTEKAGLKVGDIILQINDTETPNNQELLLALRGLHAGDSVVLTVFRMGETLEFSLVLDERPLNMPDVQEQPQEEDAYEYPFGFGGN